MIQNVGILLCKPLPPNSSFSQTTSAPELPSLQFSNYANVRDLLTFSRLLHPQRGSDFFAPEVDTVLYVTL